MLELVIKTLFICVVINFSAQAESLDDVKQEYANLLLECAYENPVSPGDIVQLQDKIMPDSENAKCLFACAYKKAGMMDENGMLSVEGVNEISEKFFSDDPEKKQKSNEFTEACRSVNDEPVSDGERGCDRAALIFRCSVEKAPQFDFSLDG